MAITFKGISQESKDKIPAFSMNGGLWIGLNKTTTFVGFIGPKLTATFSVSENLKIEAGLNGIPGVVLGKDPKPGLSLGGTVTIKHSKSKVKPVLGVMFCRTNKWQTLFGLGFLF